MSPLPEVEPDDSASAGRSAAVARSICSAHRRVVAIAPDAVELLRPASDLARLLTSFGRADVLLALEDVPKMVDDEDPDDWTHDAEAWDDMRTEVAALGHPDLAIHRLGLAAPLQPAMEGELIAAMSELIGFDPEPLVYCLAPADPPRGVLARTAERIAQIYGLPLLRFRCLELTLVDSGEAARDFVG